ncbi:putative quinol monooxygenase [Micromonospora sagamiensis]|uniref:Antibiotic biosynthesis monooxygenase n=1 Tax=Micromonospora sagamiensis TaxID=47875 RepID=A0A562WLI9_9ACTN|nr:antibiotic biosynthesis monooxygenase [Micromonospora sagamiensis]TWJ31056.1 antibiotic biosynthesis monooxygenase [Micromonospora sagamiensis]BCL15902.1 antibiotic biosynthesis monooxygenase [Micromonospora sagamiensis]
MLIIAGTLHVDPAARDEYLAGCRLVVDAARAAVGCLDFALTADLLDPGRINVYERWASDEQLLAFRDSGPSDEQTVAIRDASVHKYRISAVEAP